VAGAIAGRYGWPASDMVKRMSGGRVRVKSGVDLDTATRLATDLSSLGARCSISDDAGNVVASLPSRAASSPPVAAPRPAARAPSQPDYQTGLAAAMSADQGVQDLGILADGSAPLSVATLDGEEDRRGQQVQAVASYSDDDFAPPQAGQPDALQLAIDIKAAKSAPHPVAVPADAGMDASGPPDGAGPAHIHSAAPGAHPHAGPAAAAQNPVERVLGTLADSWRARFAAGVFLALLLGFIPVHIISSMRESSAFAEIDRQVAVEHAQVDDQDDWVALDDIRANLLERKRSKRFNIALTGVFLWGLVGGGLAYLWFRRIDWDRFSSPG